jgi:hypothetical protein
LAANYNLNIEAGATYNVDFVYTNQDGTVYNLAGFTADLQIRPTAAGSLAVEVTPTITVATGTVSVTISAAQTSTLTQGIYVYALELHGPLDSPVIRLVEGSVIVSPEVVR